MRLRTASTRAFRTAIRCAGRAQRAKIKRQRIALVNRELLRRERFAQSCNHITVNLHRMQVAQFLRHRTRERAQAGADLHHQIITLRRNRGNDGIDHGGIGQEMLAEAFARGVVARWHWVGGEGSVGANRAESSVIEQLIT